MKKTIYEQDFIQEFADYNRADQFSRQALSLIFEYLEEYDENYELDVIEICGDYSETSILEFIRDYDLDIEDFIDESDYGVEEDDEFNYDSYLKSISEVLTNYCPENYINYRILSDKLVKRKEEDGYYRILLISIYENDEWVGNSEVYFVTDLDYKFSSIAETTSDAIKIGNNLSDEEYNLELEDEPEKEKPNWEDIDEDRLEEIVSEYINNRSSVIGFTNQGTVVFQNF